MSSYSRYNTKLLSDIPLGDLGDQPLLIDRHDNKKKRKLCRHKYITKYQYLGQFHQKAYRTDFPRQTWYDLHILRRAKNIRSL